MINISWVYRLDYFTGEFKLIPNSFSCVPTGRDVVWVGGSELLNVLFEGDMSLKLYIMSIPSYKHSHTISSVEAY